MPVFSKTSKGRLAECHQNLQNIMNEVIKIKDCSIICGYRGEEEQNEAFNNGFSKLKFPESKHNKFPSLAVDVYPYDPYLKMKLIGHKNQIKEIAEILNITEQQAEAYIKEEYLILFGVIDAVAFQQGVKIRWGGDWDGDKFRLDQKFNDYPHFELI